VGLLLGIETSCDETAAALVAANGDVVGQTIRSQVDLHARYGGVVPEIAGRSHLEAMQAVLDDCFEQAGASPEDVEAVAVTHAPGLVGSLLVGLSAAKAFAFARGVPLVAVDHVDAHVHSCYQQVDQPVYPSACLVVSGGHTTLYEVQGPLDFRVAGETLDDAAGEAYDKVAAILGLPYPGGPILDRLAREGSREAFSFPRSYLGRDSLDFSFSGLKTAVLYHCRGRKGREPRELSDVEVRDIAASFQEAVVDVLLRKLTRLATRMHAGSVAIGGGVAANSRLRERAQGIAEGSERGPTVPVYLAPRELTGDNAVMVAGLGRLLLEAGITADLSLDACPSGASTLP